MTPWKLLNISLVTLLAWSVVFCQGSGQSDMSILIFVVNLTQIKNEHLSVIGQVMENAAKNSHPFVFLLATWICDLIKQYLNMNIVQCNLLLLSI